MDQIAEDIAGSLRTRHVMTPMARVLNIDMAEMASEAANRMAASEYDYAPVNRDGDLCGYVCRRDLEGRDESVGVLHAPLTAVALVAGDTPVSVLLNALRRMPFLFVVLGELVAGIVTPSDLNKQAGRSYFYILLAALEMQMAERVRDAFASQDEVLAVLSDDRAEVIRERVAQERRDDVSPDVVAALDLTDLLKVVKRSDLLRVALGSRSATKFSNEVMSPIIELRHRVMHSVRTIASDEPTSLLELINVEERIRELMIDLG